MKPLRIVNVPDVSPGDAFVDLPDVDGRPVEWLAHSGLPANAIERAVRRPRLSRYRAAWQAAGDARGADMVISHLPRMTAAVEQAARLRGGRAPHLAFSFNFTDLPVGRDLARMRRAFASVERFGVYSRHEAGLYPALFGLPADRFRAMMWGQTAPAADPSAPVPDTPFVVAIGGEGRDYASIVVAARARPDVQWLAIARPNPLFDDAPANLAVRFNLPAPLTWGIARRAAAVIVPLRSKETCCGHITIASTQLLGLPLVTTRSHATHEYVDDTPGTTVIEPGDIDALAAAAAAAVADPAPGRTAAQSARDAIRTRYDRTAWADVIADFARDFAR